MTRIVQADKGRNFSRFVNFPHQLYAGTKFYVPQLNLVQRQLLQPARNPFFRRAKGAYFIAVDEGNKVKGRIAAIYNRDHLDQYSDNTGFFGFFDCVNDQQIAGQLINTAAEWLAAKGIKELVGPQNPGTNDSVGILTRGFDKPPVFMMPYNYSYYAELMENNSLKPAMKLYSYLCPGDKLPADLQTKSGVLEKWLADRNITIRPINLNRYKQEVSALQEVYNKANEGNWGFLPLDQKGFFYMADNLKKLVKAEHILLVEKDSQIIGYSVSVPDYNQLFKKISNGRLFPFGWYRLLTGQKQINGFRIVILGILPAYRRLGIDWCLYARIAAHAINGGMKWGEACYVMENNIPMNRMMKALNAEVVNEYMIYKKAI